MQTFAEHQEPSPEADALYVDRESEELLVSALFSSSAKFEIKEFLEKVAPQDFYYPAFSSIWRAAQKLNTEGKRISRRTVLVECAGVPNIENRIQALIGNYVPTHEIPAAAKALTENAQWRGLLQQLQRSIHDASRSESYEDALEQAQANLHKLSASNTSPAGVRKLSEAVADWWDRITSDDDGEVLPTCWEDLNEKLAGGFHTKRTYIVGARPGGGKTLWLLNAAQALAEAGHPSLFVSLEMPEHEAVSRVMASGAEAEYGQITKKQIDDRNMRLLTLYTENRVPDTELYITDKASMTVENICALARRVHREKGIKALFVDYVGIVRNADRTLSRHAQLDHISWMFSSLAKELDIAVVYASQLNRGPEDGNTKPRKSDLRESGALEQNADVIILLHHEKVDGMGTGEVFLIIAKNRTGPEAEVLLAFRPHFAKIG
ncbi:DnaB-like helicase C-terminal domain-containing protein [Rhodococcus qingshengii]|uniref:DNA 5'-3' helicase n=1 Tax=Rhodococcus qingshengii TaxID=334542 RepID=A0AAW6LKG6_RHOSG|nr:DnaB-like helicase C-terminal domain-containing protein [Rhodococcus qingshengii]MDE8648152.1 DnaB-like helicase C-terminal domain-containing protein [Rhodococcus qingshengii]